MRSIILAAVCAVSAGAVLAGSPPLVGDWGYVGCDGRTVADRSPRGNAGRIEEGTVVREKGTSSLVLDGLGAAAVIDLATPLGITNQLTVSFWVRADERRNRTVLFGIPHATESWTTPVFGMYLSERRVVFGMWLDGGRAKVLVQSPGELPAKTWCHLAASYDGALTRLYLNGKPVAEEPASGAVAFNGQPLLIGRGMGSKPSLRGRVGELRVFAAALSPTAVQQEYQQAVAEYDQTTVDAPRFGDTTVLVETHGSSPADSRPWVGHPTRLLEGLAGFQPPPQPTATDTYGGRLDRPAHAATGYFTVGRVGRRWWLVDPEGHLFYHVAVNAVREPQGYKERFQTSERWAQAATEQLREAGFNGLGNWQSSAITQVPAPLVWVLRKDFMFAFARKKKLVEAASGTQGFPNRTMPIFHPEFEAFCDEFGKDLAATANSRHLLGIMTDNELQCPVDLLDRCLAIDATQQPELRWNREAAEAWWTAHRRAPTAAITLRDRYQFIAFAFERYYRIVSRAVRKHDPHHLYLGSRINYHQGEFDNPWFWRMLGPYHDVVSVNYYGEWGPDAEQLGRWAEWSGKPVLFTEWYAKAMDVPELANRFGAGWLVHTQEDRARYYQHFALAALEIPSVVGWHWFKYLDDPASSKALDSAGGANKGLCDIHGQPYAPLLTRARAVNRVVYPLLDFFDARER